MNESIAHAFFEELDKIAKPVPMPGADKSVSPEQVAAGIGKKDVTGRATDGSLSPTAVVRPPATLSNPAANAGIPWKDPRSSTDKLFSASRAPTGSRSPSIG